MAVRRGGRYLEADEVDVELELLEGALDPFVLAAGALGVGVAESEPLFVVVDCEEEAVSPVPLAEEPAVLEPELSARLSLR